MCALARDDLKIDAMTGGNQEPHFSVTLVMTWMGID